MKVKELLAVIPNEEMIGFTKAVNIYDNNYNIVILVGYAEDIAHKLEEDSYKEIYDKEVLGVTIVKSLHTYINIII